MSRLRKLALALAAASVALGLALWTFRVPLARGAARAWVVDDPLEPAEVAAVLGGGAQYRSFAAAALYTNGLVRTVLVMNCRLSPQESGRGVSAETELIERVLAHQGVPRDRTIRLKASVSSTYEEVLAIREWALEHGIRRVVIPTDAFHTRRLRRLVRRAFEGTGIEGRVQAINPPGYDWQNWWQSERGTLAFENEVAKSVLYAFRPVR